MEELLRHQAVTYATGNDLARAIGYQANSGSAKEAIRNALSKMNAVSLSIRQASSSYIQGFSAGHLLQEIPNSGHGAIEVSLSPVLAAAIHAKKGYLRSELAEACLLKTNPARLLHHRLHWINSGSIGDIYLDNMIGYVWPTAPVCGSTLRTRRQKLLIALKELELAGWSISSTARRDGLMLHIRRPPSPLHKRPLSISS